MAKRRKEGQYSLDAMATAGASSLIGMGMTQFNNKNQLKQQEKLMRMQMEGQKEMSEHNRGLAMQMWEDTNYSAQRKQMEKAGLNVGLMYGMGGGGGTTASSQPSGAPTGGNANPNAMGIEMLKTGQEMRLLQAQKDNIDADTANKIAGTKGTEANTVLTNLKGENQKLLNNLADKSMDDVLDTLEANRIKAEAEAGSALVKARIDTATEEEQKQLIKNEQINTALQAGVLKMNLKVSEAQIKNWTEQIKIGKFNANQTAEQIGLDKVAGSQLNKLIQLIYEKLGIKEETETQDKIK